MARNHNEDLESEDGNTDQPSLAADDDDDDGDDDRSHDSFLNEKMARLGGENAEKEKQATSAAVTATQLQRQGNHDIVRLTPGAFAVAGPQQQPQGGTAAEAPPRGGLDRVFEYPGTRTGTHSTSDSGTRK